MPKLKTIFAACLCVAVLSVAALPVYPQGRADRALQREATRAIRAFAGKGWIEESPDEGRVFVFGDINGDGRNDAAVSFTLTPRRGNAYGEFVMVLLRTARGGWQATGGQAGVGSQTRGHFEIVGIERGRVIGKFLICGEPLHACFKGEIPSDVKRAVVTFRRGKLADDLSLSPLD